jgi:hypothetical protein
MRVPKWWYRLQLRMMDKPSRANAVMGFVLPWILFGILLVLAGLFAYAFVANFDKLIFPIWIPALMLIVIWGFTVWVAYCAYDQNTKEGYADAILRQYSKNYNSRRRRLLGKLNKKEVKR